MANNSIKLHPYFLLPQITISAYAETGREESSIVVPLQRAYTGREPITSSLADTPCATLGVQGLLDQLNTTLRTSYSLDNSFLSSLLEDCIKDGHDFGLAYSRLRRIWYTDDWSIIQDVLWRWRDEDDKKRQKALVGNRIVNPTLPPRRVWDLYSNRVVPWWLMPTDPVYILGGWPRPISHAWMDEKDRTILMCCTSFSPLDIQSGLLDSHILPIIDSALQHATRECLADDLFIQSDFRARRFA
ncbi:hypothetical protein EDD18DRAFT_1381334 [Armillaria luteobubalina]|uniref:Heterokaryon incompatibility domain-containing protein n=1 Tax=Armillaria luteobubalina TaxID=153913 RepID=A0AA39UFN9_9AGAR|nr:hypothetical protein EDD18DRAFT_1381334 [Armillaria luteobubalina]